ncbi:copper transporter [Georgenia subflava]|uniref:Copper transporter n=1 Tax=Georgenia subflava TaxID=1622177 RepID=A0A6N7EPQ4_9MICO|nr:copper transporter [Georgenia subflava]MPV38857.1 copper transporter [Georgenia subflava]
MIDFRYHLVSLIAVFLALAVGIVLGAGPLRDTIGDTLTGQVQDLRADRERLRSELEAAEVNVTERTTYLEASAPVLLEDVLTDQRVAIVTLPGTVGDDVENLRDRLGQSGAEVVGEVAVTEAWTDPETESFRQTFAGQLLGYLDPAPADDAGTETIFGHALGHALTDSEGEDALSSDAATLLDLLTSAEAPLVTLTAEPSAPADATVLVGPRPAEVPDEEADPDEAEAAARVLAAHVDLAEALAATGRGSVTVGSAVTDLDLVTALRADETAAGTVTTVDSVSEITAAISGPLAVAVAISGSVNAYGFQTGAEEPVPPRVDISPEPVGPTEEETADGAETEPADGETSGAEPADGETAADGGAAAAGEPATGEQADGAA